MTIAYPNWDLQQIAGYFGVFDLKYNFENDDVQKDWSIKSSINAAFRMNRNNQNFSVSICKNMFL